jgi:hypothetical protein
VSFQGQPEPLDEVIINILRSRDSVPTVRVRGGQVYVVYDIAWGYDMGDQYAHVTTNISPRVEDRPIDFFFTSEIERMVDPVTGSLLFEAESK